MVADRVALRVTPPQHRRLLRWAECARLTYNWALSEWLRQYADHREALAALSDAASAPLKPFRNGIVHLFTVLREAGRMPSWAQEPLALTRNRAGRDVDHAWRNYIRGPRREAASEALLGPPILVPAQPVGALRRPLRRVPEARLPAAGASAPLPEAPGGARDDHLRARPLAPGDRARTWTGGGNSLLRACSESTPASRR